MRAKMRRAAGRIADGATVEIVAKTEAEPDAGPATGLPPTPGSPEYTLRDEGGSEETVSTRDFELLR